MPTDTKPFLFADESANKPYVVSGIMRLPAESAVTAVTQIVAVKKRFDVPSDVRIHCRTLFAPHSRHHASFSHLPVNEKHRMLLECIQCMNTLGATWWGAFVDEEKYPKKLRMVDGRPFVVTRKHLAGILVSTAIFNMELVTGPEYRLAFDPDPTKIDWGMLSKMQATHFARINAQSMQLDEALRPLLEMADIAAYSSALAKVAQREPGNRKARRYLVLAREMQIKMAEFFWDSKLPHPQV